MNKKMITYVMGRILMCEAALLLPPLVVALIYAENTLTSFLVTIGVTVACGLLLSLFKPKDKTIYARDGLVIVALSWIFMSLFGALPFYLTGEIPRFIDALFETVSGFTTTGSSILLDVEAMSKSLLFWRSFTHWIGGMGVLVFVMAILPLAGGGGNLHLMKAESPGPSVGKLVPKSNQTARILYLIYIVLTLLCVIFLLFGGMNLFESLTLSFGTAGTGGFGIVNSSIGGYSTYCQIVITVFMALFGINFNFYFLLLFKRFKDALKSSEVWTYIGIMAVSIGIIAYNIKEQFDTIGQAIQHSAFQVSSVMTTTGYSTVDFNQWPNLSKMILLGVMCIGACAGSTGGGFKVSRVMLLIKNAGKEIRAISHPRSVKVIKFDGNAVANETLRSTIAFFIIYVFAFCISVLIVSADNVDMLSGITGVIATINNIGPGLNVCGPAGNFSSFSDLSKVVFIIDMLLGRLEFFPLICLVIPPKNRKRLGLLKKKMHRKGV